MGMCLIDVGLSAGCLVTVGSVRTRRALHALEVFRADRPALWCVMVERQVAFVARYHPPAPAPHPAREDL